VQENLCPLGPFKNFQGAIMMKETPLLSLEELIERLMDEDEEMRYEAARQIAWKKRPPIERVLQWADNDCPLMREMACFILGCSGYTDASETTTSVLYPEGVPSLVWLLNDPAEDVRASAAHALGSHQVPSTLPALLRLASDPFAEVRYAVACTLGSFFEWEEEESIRYKAEVEAMLLHLMNDEDEDVRDWATFGIHQGDHNTPASRERLWKALDDPNTNIRGEAAEGLAKFGDRSLIPRLQTLLGDLNELSPCYFLAAKELDDPILLPAVLDAARRWREWGEENDWFIEPTIQTLRIAAGAGIQLQNPVATKEESAQS
jgi:hypothetical protein